MHPTAEELAAFAEGNPSRKIIEHLADCDECLAAVAAARRIPKIRSRFWLKAAAIWIIAVAIGTLWPSSNTVRLDLSQVPHETSDGWIAVSMKLPRPIEFRGECLIRMDLETDAGTVVASLFPEGKDASVLCLRPDGHLVVASTNTALQSGTRLKLGDRIESICLAVPKGATLRVKSVEIESVP